jgi:hypothetical protein
LRQAQQDNPSAFNFIPYLIHVTTRHHLHYGSRSSHRRGKAHRRVQGPPHPQAHRKAVSWEAWYIFCLVLHPFGGKSWSHRPLLVEIQPVSATSLIRGSDSWLERGSTSTTSRTCPATMSTPSSPASSSRRRAWTPGSPTSSSTMSSCSVSRAPACQLSVVLPLTMLRWEPEYEPGLVSVSGRRGEKDNSHSPGSCTSGCPTSAPGSWKKTSTR